MRDKFLGAVSGEASVDRVADGKLGAALCGCGGLVGSVSAAF